jgi:hypothetical protein
MKSISLIVFLLGFASHVAAQLITGTVTDASGAAIPGATALALSPHVLAVGRA